MADEKNSGNPGDSRFGEIRRPQTPHIPADAFYSAGMRDWIAFPGRAQSASGPTKAFRRKLGSCG